MTHEATQEPAVAAPVDSANPASADHKEARLHPVAEALLRASTAEKCAFVLKDRLIRYPAMSGVRSQANWMLLEPSQARARGLICTTTMGNGKTSLANAIAQEYRPSDDGRAPCAIKISLEGCRDARSAYGRIMEELGSPARISHRLSDRELIVVRLLRDARCRLLILDEVQDLLLASIREQQRTLEAIKYLMNRLRLPILAFGTEEAGMGFAADKHLAARFSQCTLPLWAADEILRSFLSTYERFIPLPQASDLADRPALDLLIKLSGGVLDKIVKRVQNAALLALHLGRERIDLDLLERASQRPVECLFSNVRGA